MKQLILNGREIATRCQNTFEYNGLKLTRYIITMTPEDAKEFLIQRSSLTPRKINRQTVEKYLKDMNNGKWDYCNGEAIRVDWNGKMIDFHHRLIAFYQSNEGSKDFIVLEGFNPKSTQTIDQGLNRSVLNLLQFQGEYVPENLMSIVYRKMNLDKGHLSGGQCSSNTRITKSEQVDEYFDNKALYYRALEFATEFRKSVGKTFTIAEVGGIYAHLVLTLGWDENYVRDFFTQYMNTPKNVSNIWTSLRNEREKLKTVSKEVIQEWIITFNAFVSSSFIKRKSYKTGDWFVTPNKVKNMAL